MKNTKAELKTKIDDNIYENTTGDITANDVHKMLTDLVDSSRFEEEDIIVKAGHVIKNTNSTVGIALGLISPMPLPDLLVIGSLVDLGNLPTTGKASNILVGGEAIGTSDIIVIVQDFDAGTKSTLGIRSEGAELQLEGPDEEESSSIACETHGVTIGAVSPDGTRKIYSQVKKMQDGDIEPRGASYITQDFKSIVASFKSPETGADDRDIEITTTKVLVGGTDPFDILKREGSISIGIEPQLGDVFKGLEVHSSGNVLLSGKRIAVEADSLYATSNDIQEKSLGATRFRKGDEWYNVASGSSLFDIASLFGSDTGTMVFKATLVVSPGYSSTGIGVYKLSFCVNRFSNGGLDIYQLDAVETIRASDLITSLAWEDIPASFNKILRISHTADPSTYPLVAKISMEYEIFETEYV